MLPEDLQARYAPIELLGEGGFGRVVAAHDQELDREVAIKLLHTALADGEAVGRFRREAEVTARVHHPHVVALLDSGVLPDGTPYLVYERVEGRDLENAPPTPGEIAEIAVAVAEALATAHEAGIVHRDVKPANVLRRGPGDPVLADFGIARVDSGGTQYTAEGLILGTPAFMAPELYLGKLPSPASDQFAWAASLVVMVGGGSVYGTDEVPEILKAVRRPDPVRIGPGVKQALGPLAPAVLRALDPTPARRFPDCGAFAQALRAPTSGPRPDATVQLEKAPSLEASTMALPALASPTMTTRKLLLGDGSLRALALRGLTAASLAGLLGWALWPAPAPRPRVEVPPPPTGASAPADRTSELRAEFVLAARELRSQIPPRASGDFGLPTYEELVLAYPALVEPKTLLRWNRWLRALEAWLEAAPPEELRRSPVLEALLADGVRTADFFLALFNEIKYSVQQASTAFGTLAELKSNRRRRAHPSWDIEDLNEVEQALILATEEALCRLDGLLLDEKPAGALVLGSLVSQLQLAHPSKYMAKDDPCQATTKQRLMLYLQLTHIEALSSRDLAAALPWLRGQWRLLTRVADSKILPSADRLTFLREVVAHVGDIDAAAPLAVREEVWRNLVLEIFRAPYRYPQEAPDEALALLDEAFPRYSRLAPANPEGARKLWLLVDNLKGQNWTSEFPAVEAKELELERLADTVDPPAVRTGG